MAKVCRQEQTNQSSLQAFAASLFNLDSRSEISYLNAISPEITSDKSMDGHAKGTEMSVRDLGSYLLGWNALVIKWITSDTKGLPVDFSETGYKWNQLGLCPLPIN